MNENNDLNELLNRAEADGSIDNNTTVENVDSNENNKGNNTGNNIENNNTGIGLLLIQGIATSIDALSVGFTIADYNALEAFAASLIIAVVTFIICMVGLKLGKKFGTKLAGKATILGGVILIAIGIEIFVKGVFF